MRICSALLMCLMAFGQPAVAEPSQRLGVGRLFTNDYLGDGRDRWQSGSYVISGLRGPVGWDGTAQRFGALREYRFRTAIIASDGRGAAPGDRPYVGMRSIGVHTHYGAGNTRSSLGIDLTAIGPQTGVSRFQRRAHDFLGMDQVRFTGQQLGNNMFFSMTAESAEVIPVNESVTVRPFAEVQIGPEDLVRVGVDIVFGETIRDDLMIRDVTTGHLYRGTQSYDIAGFSWVVGADYAAVADSIYLSGSGGVPAATARGRLRAGVHWQDDRGTSLFYGLTYLTPEFEGQGEGQLTGSVTLNFNF